MTARPRPRPATAGARRGPCAGHSTTSDSSSTAELVEQTRPTSPPGCATSGSPPSRRSTALPGESNRLYTPYIDLRAAQLADAAPYDDRRSGDGGTNELTEGADVLVELVEGRDVGDRAVRRRASGRRHRATSSTPTSTRSRDVLEARRALPADDKFAQLTRAAWTQGS